jgi:hypothetical protein
VKKLWSFNLINLGNQGLRFDSKLRATLDSMESQNHHQMSCIDQQDFFNVIVQLGTFLMHNCLGKDLESSLHPDEQSCVHFIHFVKVSYAF